MCFTSDKEMETQMLKVTFDANYITGDIVYDNVFFCITAEHRKLMTSIVNTTMKTQGN